MQKVMLKPIEAIEDNLALEESLEYCPGDQQEPPLSLAEACEQRISAREVYDAVIIGMLIVKNDCLGKPKACVESDEQLIDVRKELDVAEKNYLEAEERILYQQ